MAETDFSKSGVKSGVSVDWLEFTLFERKRDTFGPEMPEHRPRLNHDDRYKMAFKYDEEQAEDREKELLASSKDSTFTVEQVCSLLGELGEGCAKQQGGKFGYRSRYLTEAGVMILADGSEGMGVHVSVSGGVAQNVEDLPGLIRALQWENAKFTRIDVAVDDCDKALDLPTMAEKCKQGECSSKMKRFTVLEGGLIADGTPTGMTLYLGKRGSDFICRIYDKRLEQIYEFGVDPAKLPEHWIRVEAETRDTAATRIAEMIAAGDPVPVMAKGIFKNYFSFKDRTEDSNKARWPVCSWWSAWLGNVDKLSIGRQLKKTSIERRLKWIGRQCSASIAMILETVGAEEMTTAVASAGRDLSKKQKLEMVDYLQEQRRRKEQLDTLRNADVNSHDSSAA